MVKSLKRQQKLMNGKQALAVNRLGRIFVQLTLAQGRYISTQGHLPVGGYKTVDLRGLVKFLEEE